MTRPQRVFRILLPVTLGGVLLFLGIHFFGTLVPSSKAIWLWLPALLLFGLFGFALKRRWIRWISPRAFLLISVLIFGFLLALQVTIPRSEEATGTLEWIRSEERKSLDLSGTFKTLDGRDVSMENFRKKVLFLNVWATWCGPCLQEMPEMASLYQKLAHQGLSMIAVTDENSQTVREFLKRNPYPFPIWLDPDNVLAERFGIQVIPETFVVDGQGRLALRRTGSHRWASQGVLQSFRDLLDK